MVNKNFNYLKDESKETLQELLNGLNSRLPDSKLKQSTLASYLDLDRLVNLKHEFVKTALGYYNDEYDAGLDYEAIYDTDLELEGYRLPKVKEQIKEHDLNELPSTQLVKHILNMQDTILDLSKTMKSMQETILLQSKHIISAK